jgi:ribose 5-phosphate isomerase B
MKNLPKKNAEKKIFIAADHAGFTLKNFLVEELAKLGFKMVDLGCNSAEKSVDYPDFAKKLSLKINKNSADFGILICGSGIGISIAANRFKHIRAALCHNVKSAKSARAHNDANVLCLGARSMSNKLALAIAKVFLAAKFEGGRHDRRVSKLSE